MSGTSQGSSSEDIDPELAGFCQRFNFEPRVQDFDGDGDREDTHESRGLDSDHDPSDRSEIIEQSELDHFSAVLQCAQQIASQLEKEKDKSRKRKTPKQYRGNSLKTLSRRKRAKLQLAEKGFLGVFEFLNLQKQTELEQLSTGATNNLTRTQSAKQDPVREEEEEDSPDEDGVKADMTPFAATPANMTTASATSPLSPGPRLALTTGIAATSMVGAHVSINDDATSVTVSEVVGISMEAEAEAMEVGALTTLNTAAEEAVTAMEEEGVEDNPNGPQDDWVSEVVRILTLKPVWTDGVFVQGAGNDTSPKVIEQGIEALSDNNEDVSNNGSVDEESDTDNPIRAEARRAVDAMLEDLRQSHREMATGSTGGALTVADQTLDLWNDRAALGAACVKLSERRKENSLDVILCARITAMVGVLNLYLDSGLGYSWRNASLVVAKARGQGKTHARNLRKWILDFIRSDQLPLHRYGQSKWTVLDDEDISQSLQLKLSECAKRGYLKAADVVEIVSSPEMQASLTQVGVSKPTIAERTARDWLKKLNWRYEEKRNGMYIDGHEREDVVRYRIVFVTCWKEYETRFHKWDNDGNPLPLPTSFGGHARLILVTHDESTFYQNDERKTHWAHSSSTPTPKPKGNGQSLMISDFLTVEWGRLCHGNECVFSFFTCYLGLTHPNTQSSKDFIQSRQKSRGLFRRRRSPQTSQPCHRCFREGSKWAGPSPLHV